MGKQEIFRSFRALEQLTEQKTPNTITVKHGHDGKGNKVYVSLDTQGRKGKSVTIVSGLRHNPTTMEEIARVLKQFCGAGGTVKEGKIEVQGDQRDRVSVKLRELNYTIVDK